MGKSQDLDSGSGCGMKNPDHISESLETSFSGLKYLMMWIRDPGSRRKKFGSG
jgi:hypothetical protein